VAYSNKIMGWTCSSTAVCVWYRWCSLRIPTWPYKNSNMNCSAKSVLEFWLSLWR